MMLGDPVTGPVQTAENIEWYPQVTPSYTGKMCFESPWVPWIGRERTIQNVRVGDPKTYCAALIENTGTGVIVYARIAATALLAWWLFGRGSK